MTVLKKIMFALVGWGVCAAALAGPVVIDTYAPAKGAKTPQFTVDADTRPLDADQLGQSLAAVVQDKGRGADTPVAVLLDPALTLVDVGNLVELVDKSGLKHVRYFVYDGGRTMVAEAVPRAGQSFPRSRLDSEVMAAPK